MMNCKCATRIDAELEKRGFRLSPRLFTLRIDEKPEFNLRLTMVLPLERLDGKRLARKDPKTLEVSYCPFCGMDQAEEAKGAAHGDEFMPKWKDISRTTTTTRTTGEGGVHQHKSIVWELDADELRLVVVWNHLRHPDAWCFTCYGLDGGEVPLPEAHDAEEAKRMAVEVVRNRLRLLQARLDGIQEAAA
jgi:hypothetical protein